MRLRIDPALSEAAVFERMRVLAAHGEPEAGAWDRAREALYAEPAEHRARAFARLSEVWFERLELARPLRAALARTPHVSAGVSEVRLLRAARRAHEGSELYRDGPRTRLVFGLTAAGFAQPAELEGFFLRECLFAEDMLDPAVGYVPELGQELVGAPARADLVRDRLRVLWEARVRGRIARFTGNEGEHEPGEAFRRAFGGALGAEALAGLHARVTTGGLGRFEEWLAAARG